MAICPDVLFLYPYNIVFMKNKGFLLWLLALSAVLVGCSSDDDGAAGGGASANSNSTVVNSAAGRLEFPKTRDDANSILVVHTTDGYGVNYAVEWDCEKRAQRWTCYQMYAANSVTNWNRNGWNNTTWQGQTWHRDPFQEDPDLPEQYRTTLDDYGERPYQRGHICPSADRLCSQDANGQTFYLSNMQPQYGNFNSGLWLVMENKVRSWNISTFRDTLYVCKGGTIEDYGDTQGVRGYTQSGLIVPRYFFMAVLCKRGNIWKAIAFWAEHENVDRSSDKLSDHVVNVRELERRTGIDFFCNLPDDTENYVETMPVENILRAWNVQ